MARALLLSLVVAVSAAAPAAAANPWLAPERKLLNIAHQGGEDEAPSNTLFSYQRALALGADMLEMDVNITADRRVVVMHDTHLGRMCRPDLKVNQLTLDEVKKYDPACRDWQGTYAGIATGDKAPPPGFTRADFQIPTLEEVVERFPGVLMNVEIKGAAPDHADVRDFVTDTAGRHPTALDNAVAVAGVLNRYKADRVGRTIVVSFADSAIELFHLHAPDLDVATGLETTAAFWASTQGPLPGLTDSRHVAVQPPLSFNGVTVVNQDFVTDAHRNGLAVHPWTINSEADMRQLLDWGVEGIMTDKPCLLEEVLRDYRPAPRLKKSSPCHPDTHWPRVPATR